MPFIQRCLEPINVSRVKVEKGIKNELECVTNHTLSNIILQLSSLCKHTEDMFTELSIEVKTFTDRTQHLQGRIDHLRKKVTRLDAAAGAFGSIHELHLKKPYKSSTIYDQQVVSKSTMPRCILKAYSHCDPTPALNKLSHYRDDGRDSLKFYTDPGYFFELWFLDIQKDIENKKMELELKSRKKKKPKSETNQGKKPRIVKTKAERYKEKKHGVEFIQYANPTEIQAAAINKQLRSESFKVNQRKQESVPYDQKDQYNQDVSNHTNNGNNKHEHKVENGDHQKAPMPHSQLSSQPNVVEKYSSGSIYPSKSRMPPPNQYPYVVNKSHCSPTRDDLPPPPPPPLSEVDYPSRYASKKIFTRDATTLRFSPEKEEDDLPLPPFPSIICFEPILTIPPAPQAPPPPPINTKMVPTNASDNKNSTVQSSSAVLMSLKRKSTRRQSALVGSSNFLEQIRGGIHLRHLDDIMKRKVNENEKGIFKKSTPDGNFDVHSIMNRAFEMRRKVIEESEEEDGSLEDDWD